MYYLLIQSRVPSCTNSMLDSWANKNNGGFEHIICDLQEVNVEDV